MEEIEADFLEIDVAQIKKTLQKLGARKVFEKLYKRKVLAINGDYHQTYWVRVRDEGDKVTLTYKKPIGAGQGKGGMDLGMEEIEVTVSDFDKTVLLLEKLGLQVCIYEENKRIRYELEGVEIDIDTWPLIPSFLEIEANSWEKIDLLAQKLGLDPEKKLICPIGKIYSLYKINVHDYEMLTFEKQVKKAYKN